MNESKGPYGLVSEYPYETSIRWFDTLEEAVAELQSYGNHDNHSIIVKVQISTSFVNPLTGETVEVTQ